MGVCHLSMLSIHACNQGPLCSEKNNFEARIERDPPYRAQECYCMLQVILSYFVLGVNKN